MTLVWYTKLSVVNQPLCATAKNGCLDAHAEAFIVTALPRHTDRFLLQHGCMIKLCTEQPPAVAHHLGRGQLTARGYFWAPLLQPAALQPHLQLDWMAKWAERTCEKRGPEVFTSSSCSSSSDSASSQAEDSSWAATSGL